MNVLLSITLVSPAMNICLLWLFYLTSLLGVPAMWVLPNRSQQSRVFKGTPLPHCLTFSLLQLCTCVERLHQFSFMHGKPQKLLLILYVNHCHSLRKSRSSLFEHVRRKLDSVVEQLVLLDVYYTSDCVWPVLWQLAGCSWSKNKCFWFDNKHTSN